MTLNLGVIYYPAKTLFLCSGVTQYVGLADYVTTTEVYPDSPKSDDATCNVAQVACVTGGLDYLVQQLQN